MRRLASIWLSLLLLSAAMPGTAPGASLLKIGDFDRPVSISSDPGDPNRLLVGERQGRVVLLGSSGASVYADIAPLVTCCEVERGLLSLAPAPDFHSSGRIYVAYTGEAATAGGATGDVHVDSLVPAAGGLQRQQILVVGHAGQPNHNGGQLEFGPDGFLYVSLGDGGGTGDPGENAQSLDSLLGKVLRIDPRPGASPGYAIPPGNPFGGATGRAEIWSYGLRNPWRFSIDDATGDMAIGDVGQDTREEVDFAPGPAAGTVGGAGANYGWNCREGSIPYPGAPVRCDGLIGFIEPILDYPHDDPGDGSPYGCSVTGGYVVRDPGLDDLYGRYLYADFCSGEIRSLRLPDAAGEPAIDDRGEGLPVVNPSSFGEDSCARVYVASLKGPVYRLVGATVRDCPSPAGPASMQVATVAPTPRRPGLTLRRSSGVKHRRVKLTVRLTPCSADWREAVVQLNRGGRRLAAKRVDDRCIARFRPKIDGRTSFRALLLAPRDGVVARSHRIWAGASPRSQRSQVRTIALAKPTP